MPEERKPAFYAILPAKVRYDRELRPNAKLLYAEITALANDAGYCWASNGYFAELFELAKRTVADLIKQLADKGYITVDIRRDPETNEVLERRLWVDTPSTDVCDPPPAKNGMTPPAENNMTPPAKNGIKNNTSNNNTPLTPQGGKSAKKVRTPKAPREAPDWKPDRFAGFWSYYPAKGRRNKQKAMDAWDRLRPDDTLIDRIAAALKKLKATEEWQRNIGIPHVSTFLNGARWEDAEELGAPEKPQEAAHPKPGRWVYEIIDGEEVAFWEEDEA